jgi:SAM-dependent methyltransferase
MTGLAGLAGALGIGGFGAKALARAIGPAAEGAAKVAALNEPVARAIEQAGHQALMAPVSHGRVPLDDGVADAVCVAGLPAADVAPLVLDECARVVKPGGRVLVATASGLTRRGPERSVVTALFLHAGLVDLEQRLSRGTVITSGRVRR